MIPLIVGVAEERAQQLVCSIGRHYYAMQASRDAVDELSRYATELPMTTPARVSMLATLALMHVHQGDVEAAEPGRSAKPNDCSPTSAHRVGRGRRPASCR